MKLADFLSFVSVVSDFAGIISLALTIILLIYSEITKKEIMAQKSEYKDEQWEMRKRLIELRKTIVEGDPFNMKVISEIRTELYGFKKKYKHILSYEDKIRILITLKMLHREVVAIDKSGLCEQLDYFVAHLEKRER